MQTTYKEDENMKKIMEQQEQQRNENNVLETLAEKLKDLTPAQLRDVALVVQGMEMGMRQQA